MEWTKENIATRRYGRIPALGREGMAYEPGMCAEEVCSNDRFRDFSQCLRKPGHGPDGLYCKQHAKMKEGK